MFIAELKVLQGRQQIAQVRYFPLYECYPPFNRQGEEEKTQEKTHGMQMPAVLLSFCTPGSFLVAVLFSGGWGNGKE